MRSTPRRCTVAALLVGMGLCLPAGPASAASVSDCTSHALDQPSGSLTLAGPGTAAVPSGTSVNLSAQWSAPGWAEKATLLVCTTTGGTANPAASGSFPVASQDSAYSAPLTIPADVPPATDVCAFAVLVGHASDGTGVSQVSRPVCLRTAAVVTPTTVTTTAVVATPPAGVTTTTTAGFPTPEKVIEAGTTPAPGQAIETLPTTAATSASRPQLPRTGGPVGALAELGALTVAVGCLLRRLGRRPAEATGRFTSPGGSPWTGITGGGTGEQ